MNTMKTLTVIAIAVSALAATVGSSQAMSRGGSFGYHGFGGHGPAQSSGMHRGISCFACNLPRRGYGGYREHHGWGYGNRYWNYGHRYWNYRSGYAKPWRYGYWGRYWNRWSYWPRPVFYGEVPVTPVAATPVAPIATPAVLAPAPVAEAPVAEAPAVAPAPAVAITCSAAPGAAITCSAVAPPVDAH